MNHAVQRSIDVQEAIEKIRSHWLNHVIHALRGPVFAARGYTRLLLDQKGGEVTVTQRTYLETILENIEKIAGSVTGLQQLPSVEGLNLEMVDLFDLLDSALAEHRQTKTLHLGEHIDSQAAPTVADRAKLGFAVHKLLGGMVEFSRYSGKMDVHARREEDEFLMRITASANISSPPGEREILQGLESPCEIIRLHGGIASAECRHPGLCNVSVRLPLIQPGAAAGKGK